MLYSDQFGGKVDAEVAVFSWLLEPCMFTEGIEVC